MALDKPGSLREVLAELPDGLADQPYEIVDGVLVFGQIREHGSPIDAWEVASEPSTRATPTRHLASDALRLVLLPALDQLFDPDEIDAITVWRTDTEVGADPTPHGPARADRGCVRRCAFTARTTTTTSSSTTSR
jgi:hypothetical protein